MKKPYLPINLKKIRTYSVADRKTRSETELFAKTSRRNARFIDFYNNLPDFLGAKNLKAIIEAIKKANRKKRPVIIGMGAHVIKVGLSPLIIDLMKKGIINGVALNGAGAIHDFEIAAFGRTSEDVAEGLETGMFGMVKETMGILNQAVAENGSSGFGKAVGEKIIKLKSKHSDKSILAAAAKLGLPATVHAAIGTDTIHMSDDFDPAACGNATFTDFRLFCSVVSDLEGGVYINIGSAVILPEVFLKALTVARNLGNKVENFTTVNMDMLQHYRPYQNVLKRPGGKNYALTGHHEIMVPLLYQALL